VPDEPVTRLAAVAGEPRAGRAFAKAVAPGIHVGQAALASEGRQICRQQSLEVADGAFLVVVAAGIRVEAVAPRRIHADVMGELVQQRMNRRVRSEAEMVPDEPGLGLSPEGARDGLARRDRDTQHAVAAEQTLDGGCAERIATHDERLAPGARGLAHAQPGGGVRLRASIRRMTWRARSSASARRSNDSSRSLPSTSVSS